MTVLPKGSKKVHKTFTQALRTPQGRFSSLLLARLPAGEDEIAERHHRHADLADMYGALLVPLLNAELLLDDLLSDDGAVEDPDRLGGPRGHLGEQGPDPGGERVFALVIAEREGESANHVVDCPQAAVLPGQAFVVASARLDWFRGQSEPD